MEDTDVAPPLRRRIEIPIPLVGKYRPQTVDDILGHDYARRMIKAHIDRKLLIHMLLHGPAGTGKTSMAMAYAKGFYGRYFSKMMLELNSSDGVDMDKVCTDIQSFITSASLCMSVPELKGLPKLVILDEADQMDHASQEAVNRLLEKHVRHARFIFIVNNEEKMIDGIHSRCTKVRFEPLPKEIVTARILQVAEVEGIRIFEEAAAALTICAEGDLRKALNYLQQTACVGDDADLVEVIYKKAGKAPPEAVFDFATVLLNATTLREGMAAVQRFTRDRACTICDLVNLLYRQLRPLGIPENIRQDYMDQQLSDLQYSAAVGIPDSHLHQPLAIAFFQTKCLMTKMGIE